MTQALAVSQQPARAPHTGAGGGGEYAPPREPVPSEVSPSDDTIWGRRGKGSVAPLF